MQVSRIIAATLTLLLAAAALAADNVHVSKVSDDGWAANSVNATSFRRSAVTSRDGWQFTGFYDSQSRVVLAKRKVDSEDWQVHVTQYTGNARDAHNGVNLGLDAEGYLHVAWDHHNNPLHYARSTEPMGLELGAQQAMIGSNEDKLSYPQFYALADGRLLFLYRDGSSGNGNLVINRYDASAQSWQRVHDVLIDGEGQRNAYWQAAVDGNGSVHVSWVWRETWDVATNHDMAYARSDDGGETWVNSKGQPYKLPINASTAEYAMRIPQKHELINQTSMACDGDGRPYITTYFRSPSSDVPQFRLIWHDGKTWKNTHVGARTQAFSLSGGGTKRIPIARPQIAVGQGSNPAVHVIYRDAERGSVVTIATCDDLGAGKWAVQDVTEQGVGQWEPQYDHALWRSDGRLDVFVQSVEQLDAEGVSDQGATSVSILQWRPD